MPSLSTIQSTISELNKGPPITVALPGGTTGIGSYIARALATTYANHGNKLRVYIIGRNATRAENVLSECRKTSPGSEWRFIQTPDLALISEVDRCCAEIVRQETQAPFHGGKARLDLLYMTYSYPDGTKPGQFPVGCPTDAAYGVGAVRKHASFMKTMIFEELAKKHAGNLRLTHIYPGLVDGPTFLGPDSPMWFKILWRVSKPLMSWYMTAPDGERGGGSYSVGQKADASKGIMYEKVRQADTKEKIWRHTMETLERAEKAGRLSK
ncbi:uncharacterized protein CC84DRAFT_1143473 [Paraphaeosphaeria sporulosa]|uniref:NAD(P)-binding protein n=1 Tax=Paraphaeosphaeria sporulosa TaxID=1460663 RepID=A0A177CI10_9PLEO|nr:uncharacterized protein CC84DRAFT_1143473 [Paraphaeosphaeria sporulosa]OAG07143.1 hypothetical protein CC84DRAFT_1143473 [Paraphaeosphaeria sporulosa]